MRVYIDESGYTGEDLANRDQPVFVLASVSLSDANADQLISHCFSGVRATELKHSSLAKRTRGQEMILEFVKQLEPSSGAAYVVHKEFCLLTKLVDLWLEPAMHAANINFYEGGANISFSNMSFFCLRTFEGRRFLTKHLRRFQRLMRERTGRRYREFWGGIRSDLAGCRKESAEILKYFVAASFVLGPGYLPSIPEKSLDISLACALQLAEEWTDRTTDLVEIVHDASSAMAREKWIWDAVVSPSAPSATVGFAHRKRKYPLRVTRTVLQNSKSSPGLQLADMLAGSVAEWAKGKMRKSDRRKYCAALERGGIDKLLIGGIWPVPKVERLEALPGERPVDPIRFFGDVILKARRANTE